ncbi:hypothetical protein LXL04_011893 [Taraxacum kok-saghyz]
MFWVWFLTKHRKLNTNLSDDIIEDGHKSQKSKSTIVEGNKHTRRPSKLNGNHIQYTIGCLAWWRVLVAVLLPSCFFSFAAAVFAAFLGVLMLPAGYDHLAQDYFVENVVYDCQVFEKMKGRRIGILKHSFTPVPDANKADSKAGETSNTWNLLDIVTQIPSNLVHIATYVAVCGSDT